MRRLVLSAFTLACLGACTSSETTLPSSITAELLAVSKAQDATEAAATNSNGLTKGTDFSLSSLNPVTTMSTAFNAETDCATSGWPASGNSGDVGYAMKFLLCSVLKSPDGPDTVRGGFDRITGMLCAAGNISYDGAPQAKTMTFSTDCFTQTFVTTACSYISGTSSNGPCSADATVTGFSSVTGVAPSGFDKYLTISLLGGGVEYTLAHKITTTSVSGAIMGGLPSTSDASVEDAFAFHIDSSAGKMRFEGRFAGTNKRHMRINLVGTVSADFSVTDVNTLSFVQGENFGNNSGLIVSVNGTPSAGRRLRVRTTNDMNNATPTWGAANADDNDCVGEVGATCTGNNGILETDKKFFFDSGSGFTSSKTWFTSNSYLGDVSDTVDMDDVWD